MVDMARESKNKISGIYKITNEINGKAYIGQSNDIHRRWKEHRCKHSWKSNHVIYRAFKKYGIDNFTFEIVCECDIENLSNMERHYIKQFGTFGNGYNETEGGEGISGFRHSEETKRKLSEAVMGENHHMYGKPMSEEQKQLRRDMFKGREFTEEHKKHLSESRKGTQTRGLHNLAKMVECNGVVYDCVKDCSDDIKESYNAILNWLNKKDNMPQKYIDLGLRYHGDTETVYVPQDCKSKPYKLYCDGVVYQSVKDFCEVFGVKPNTVKSWVTGRRKMQIKFKELGLCIYNE